ncbi:epithelial membrane protein 1-like [Styela clava]
MNIALFVAFLVTSVGAVVLSAWTCGDTHWLENGASNIGIWRNCTAGTCEYIDSGDGGRTAAAFLILACFPLSSLAIMTMTNRKNERGWFPIFAAVSFSISAVFILIAVATYGGTYANSALSSQGYNLGYSYGLACGGLGLCLIGIVLGFASKGGQEQIG